MILVLGWKNGILIGTYPIKIILTAGIVGFIIITTSFRSIKGKLTKTEQESLKMILLRPSTTRALDIKEFLTDKKFSNGRVCPYCGKNHIVRNLDLILLY